MDEGGKPFTMRTVVMAVAQWVRLGYGAAEIRLYRWASEARDLPNWKAMEEYPAEMLTCEDTSNWEGLIQVLGDQPNGKILLLTDGFWPRAGEKLFRRWRGCLPPDTLRIIKIGADSNPRLTGEDVFSAEEFFAALDGWLQGRGA